MANSKISTILSKLMLDRQMRTTELARLVNIPQPTLHRIVTGTTSNPHPTSLVPIANFFSITVEQLKGLEPIPGLENNFSVAGRSGKEIPLLSWEEAAHWQKLSDEERKGMTQKIFTDMYPISKHAFALKLQDSSMEPVFPPGTMLIFDPERSFKDRDYVVVRLRNQNKVVFRQILVDAQQLYLKPLSPDLEHFKMLLIDEGDEYCGVLVQSRRDYA